MTTYTILTSPDCQPCKVLKSKLQSRNDITWIDTSTKDGEIMAIMEEVFTLPTLITEDGRKITGLNQILKEIK